MLQHCLQVHLLLRLVMRQQPRDLRRDLLRHRRRDRTQNSRRMVRWPLDFKLAQWIAIQPRASWTIASSAGPSRLYRWPQRRRPPGWPPTCLVPLSG